MNPYKSPKAPAREMRVRRIPKQEPAQRRAGAVKTRKVHGALAATLLLVGLLIRFGVPVFMEYSYSTLPSVLLLSLLGAVFWVWGCFHLALRFGLSPAWGLFGLLFLLGFFVILWAARQKPKWDIAAARRTSGKPRVYRGDPNSLY